VAVAWFFVLLSGAGCRKAREPAPPPPSPSSVPDSLGPREEAVILADKLALSGSRALNREADALLERAASLREQLYRRERRQVDALEAVEILRELGRRPGQACRAALRRILLEAEVTRDPVAAYRALEQLEAREDPVECGTRRDRALLSLSVYRSAARALEAAEGVASSPAPGTSVATPPATAGVVQPRGVTPSSGPSRITRVEQYGGKEAARVVVHSTAPALFQVGKLEDEGQRSRLYVDVKGATLDAKNSYDVGGLVERVRLGQNSDSVRIVLELTAPAERRVFYVPEPFRLVIDVSAAGKGPLLPAPQPGGRRVQRVVLDPGHGGNDPGAIGPSGLREKDVTLDIAHRAAPLLARQLDVTTLLTRDGDHYVPLEERIARANAFSADLFVSIHCNASEDGGGSAIMTFVLDETREDSAMRLAARENAASAAAGAELANAMLRLSGPEHAEASLHFAGLLQRAAMSSLSRGYGKQIPDGGVKRAGFYVLAGALMPAVLFESSFISSPDGETRFNTADFRQRLADAIVNAVRAYREGL
jgi:N-acetylmuramoyl-L-alanine amidase